MKFDGLSQHLQTYVDFPEMNDQLCDLPGRVNLATGQSVSQKLQKHYIGSTLLVIGKPMKT